MSDNTTPWVCIARAGSFADSAGREHTFTESDLEAIRASYDPSKSEAPLVLGHPKDSAPAFGWVRALKVERSAALPGAIRGGTGDAGPSHGYGGAKLFAQFAHVPAEVKKLVQDRRYRYVSMSLAPDKKRLLHVGLLGAAAPAIDGLSPVEFEADGITINFAQENNMDVQELQKQIGALTEKLKAAQAENEALKGKLAEADKGKGEADKGKKDAEEKASKTAADFAAFQAKIAGDARAARIRALVDSGKLEPAREAETLSFAAALALVAEPVNFSAEGGKPEQVSAEERYFRELEARPVDPRFNVNFAAPAPAHAAGAKTEQYVTVTDKL